MAASTLSFAFGHSNVHDPLLYLVILTAILSSQLLFSNSVTGQYILLWISAPLFFLMFGFGDLLGYLVPVPAIYHSNSPLLLSPAEAVILVSFACLYLGYVLAVKITAGKPRARLTIEWPVNRTFVVGIILFALGVISTFAIQVSNSKYQLYSNSGLDIFTLNLAVLGRMGGELGEVLLAYVLVKTKSKPVKHLIIGLIILKFPLGILLNAKYVGVSFLIAYIVVAWVYNKKMPWKAAIIGGLAIVLLFPVAYTYRAYMAKYDVSVGETLDNISGNLAKAFSQGGSRNDSLPLYRRITEGMESVAGRANMKPSVALIVSRAGHDIPFENGNTLEPLLYIFIPRFIYSDKPTASVGRSFNQKFQISLDPDTWISTSFIGELYWNFSWTGVITGMFLVGATLGLVGRLANITQITTVSRLLIILVTIATLVFKFQTGIAQQYSLFLRAIVIIFLLNILFGRRVLDTKTN